MSDIRLFGIRHHGPGSARSLKEAFSEWQPDILLIEAPADGDKALPLVAKPDMEPPVALLVYDPKKPKRSAYFPFAVFSPEWQAMQYGFSHDIPVRFMDLPQANRLAMLAEEEAKSEDSASMEARKEDRSASAEALAGLAQAAGFSDHESWWNQMIEQRQDSAGLFNAILETMTVLREDAGITPRFDAQREAYMRNCIRQAKREKYSRIAVVCGAWHAPALVDMPTAKQDKATLKGMPRIRVEATWVPWTYGRLSYFTGYGAGIKSPGWYQHLWEMGQAGLNPTDSSIRWLTKVADLLRQEELDASAAHVIEALRLAEATAALRGLPMPGLTELNEAVKTVICFGGDEQMRLIQKRLIVGEKLGSVPASTPMVPFQRDLQALQRRLRLRPEPEATVLKLDLRKPIHLERSHLLHRLALMGIPWGQLQEAPGGSLGTFHELWQLEWLPDFAVLVIEAGMWGNTVQDGATQYAADLAEKGKDLPALTALLDKIILADLPDTVSAVMRQIEEIAALSGDVPLMMDALPPLARAMRYGNVRGTDSGMIKRVVDGLVTRICIGLPTTCASLDDDAAAEMFQRLVTMQGALNTLHDDDHLAAWQETLGVLADQGGLHGLLAGRVTRMLLDAGIFQADEAARRLQLALSNAQSTPMAAAFWIDGFLQGSGMLLVHDDVLWRIIDEWILRLDEARFVAALPLLRRTFATFSKAERRRLGENLRRQKKEMVQQAESEFDPEMGALALPLAGKLLGLELSVE